MRTYSYPDKVRGLFNEGGLYGEREGWHLPGFDTSGAEWTARELSAGLPSGGAGVGFFVTTFELDIPSYTDTPLSFQFEATNDQPYRALLFVNGWQFGKVRGLGVRQVRVLIADAMDLDLVARGERGAADEVPRPPGHLGLQRTEVRRLGFFLRCEFGH